MKYLIKPCLVSLLFFSAGTLSFAESLDRLFDTALENDNQHRILELSLENRQLAIERGNLEANFRVDVGTGGITFQKNPYSATSLSNNELPWNLSMGPSVSVTLNEGIETVLTVSSGVEYRPAFTPTDPTESEVAQKIEFTPVVAVNQPLNPLFGIEASERGARLSESESLLQARMALWSRELAVKRQVIGALKEILGLRMAIGDAERSIQLAEQDLEKARKLGTYAEGSVDLVALQNGVHAKVRTLELTSARLALADGKFSELVGTPMPDTPVDIPLQALDLPRSFDVDRHPAVRTSTLKLEMAQIALEEHLEPFIPRYSIGASYDIDKETVGAELSAVFEDFSVGSSFSTDFTGDAFAASVTASWSLPDRRAERILTRELELGLEIARISHESTLRRIATEAESLRMQIQEFEYRRVSLEEGIRLAELILEDSRKRFELGVLGERELRNAEWNLEKLSVDMVLADLDARALALDIEALTYE